MVAATSHALAPSRPATPTPVAAASARPAPARVLPNVSVLIVEEEGYTRTLVSTVARAIGVEHIATANGAKAAFKVIEESKVNLVVCDLHLAEMSGLEFLAELRRRAPHVQFMLISNQSDPEHIQRAVNSGVSAILVRPFSRAQVEAKLRYLVYRIAPGLVPSPAAPAQA